MGGGNKCYDENLDSNASETFMEWIPNSLPSENLLGSIWRLDSGFNGCYFNKRNKDYLKIYKYNFLKILSDRILITNLGKIDKIKNNQSKDDDDELLSPEKRNEESYIHLKYMNTTKITSGSVPGEISTVIDADFIDNEDNIVTIALDKKWISDRHIQMKTDPEVKPSIKILIDPLTSDDGIYAQTDRYSSSGPRQKGQILKGIQLRTEINFSFQNYQPTNNVCYWRRMYVKNSCAVKPSLYSDIAKKIKCMKYEIGKYENNLHYVYNNLILSLAQAKGTFSDSTFNGDCPDRNKEQLNLCNSITHENEKITEKNHESIDKCLESLNCKYSNIKSVENILTNGITGDGNMDPDYNNCPSRTTGDKSRCLLYETQSSRKLIEDIVEKMKLYDSYEPHRNPFSNTDSEFSEDCNGKIINQVEQMCIDKNIGIDFAWEPESCDPTSEHANLNDCTAKCETDNCKTPTLVKIPKLSSYMCTLDNMNKLDKKCHSIEAGVINNPSYLNLFNQNDLKMFSFNKDNYPSTGCSEAVIEEYLLYIKFKLLEKAGETQEKINNQILSHAEFGEELSAKRLNTINSFKTNIKTIHAQLLEIKSSNIESLYEIGRINNTYEAIKLDINKYNKNLELSKVTKKVEYIIFILIGFLILNLLLFSIIFRN
jgi:hypothetical protein